MSAAPKSADWQLQDEELVDAAIATVTAFSPDLLEGTPLPPSKHAALRRLAAAIEPIQAVRAEAAALREVEPVATAA